MPDIDKNYYLDREGIDTLATEVKSKIADAAKTVKQSATTTNADYEVLFSQSANNTTTTEEAGKNSNLKFNPSTGNLQATQLNGVTIGNDPKFTDNNTTYTFANGTNGFTVTPSGGTAQTVTVTPSIANNITGSGTNGYLTKFNGANTVTNGPALGSDTTKYLRNDGSWQVPQDPKKFTITGSQPTSYRRGVIALCRVSTSANTSFDSFSSGTITFHRDNGLNGVRVIKYAIENQYATAYAANVSNLGSNFPEVASPTLPKGKGWSWCSFKHNDIYYAGIEFYIADAELGIIIDDYVGNFEPFGFTWYDAQNSTVLDSEFSNSVSYTTPAHLTDEFTVKKAESATDNTKVAKAGDLMTGTLRIESTNGNYGEGIRINKGNGGYSTLVFNTNAGTTSGIQDGAWWVGANNDTYGRKLFIAHNGSGASTTYFYADSSSQVSPSLKVGSNIVCDGVIASNQTSGTSGGFSLYGGAGNVTSYGIAMRTTANSGKHGYVQGDWAGYFYFAGSSTTRGLIYRHAGANVASISAGGNAVFNGSVTIGGNDTNTSGARMEYNSTTQSIDFVFV